MRSRVATAAATVITLALSVSGSVLHAVAAPVPSVTVRNVASAGDPNTLYAGQALIASRHSLPSLRSQSGEFWLYLSSGFLELDQIAPTFGLGRADIFTTGVWFRDAGRGRSVAPHDRTALRMRRNGNLVLVTQRGRVLWSTHTAGTGAHNRLVVRNNGNMVIFTGAGKQVWASGTTPVVLGANESLPSGHRMVVHWGEQSDIPVEHATVTMQSDGNLVYRCNGHAYWSSNTHVRGAYLVMQDDGNAVVRAPDGRRLWSTRTKGAAYAVFEILDVHSWGRNARVVWDPHLPDSVTC